MELPPQAYLRECFDYDAESGTLMWRERPRSHFAHECGFRGLYNRPRKAGSTKHHGYLALVLDGRRLYVHRLIWKLMTDTEPVEIDHINRDGSDNRWSNLRVGTHADNMKNVNWKPPGKFGRGVYRQTMSGRYAAKRAGVYLGTFDTPEEAEAAYHAVAPAS